MIPENEDRRTAELVDRAARGDVVARDELFSVYRHRLLRMVACRLDPRVAGRVDASDVVQEALIDADQKLEDYLRRRPLPFYLWLRQIAWERILKTHRWHIQTEKRSVRHEHGRFLIASRGSAAALARRLVACDTSPSERVARGELLDRVAQALASFGDGDGEVLVLRHVEHLSVAEVAQLLGLSEGAVKLRSLRALRRLRERLGAGPLGPADPAAKERRPDMSGRAAP